LIGLVIVTHGQLAIELRRATEHVTDMFGGTPSNLAISMLRDGKVEVLAGVNLPMLIKLAEARETASLEEAAEKAKTAGQRYIAIASKILSGDA